MAKILKEKLYFSEKALKNWKLDGKSFLSLKDTEIDKLIELSQEEKDKLKSFLSKHKSSSKIEATSTEKTKPENIKTEQDKNEIIITEEPKDNEKDKNKKEEKKNYENAIKISKESKKEEIIKFLEKYYHIFIVDFIVYI